MTRVPRLPFTLQNEITDTSPSLQREKWEIIASIVIAWIRWALYHVPCLKRNGRSHPIHICLLRPIFFPLHVIRVNMGKMAKYLLNLEFDYFFNLIADFFFHCVVFEEVKMSIKYIVIYILENNFKKLKISEFLHSAKTCEYSLYEFHSQFNLTL